MIIVSNEMNSLFCMVSTAFIIRISTPPENRSWVSGSLECLTETVPLITRSQVRYISSSLYIPEGR